LIAAEINDQLLQIEQRLNHEISTLRVATAHLNHVRQLRSELERLLAQARAVNQEAAGQEGAGPEVPPPNAIPGSSVFVTGHQYGANPGTDVLNSGDPRLPEGLTLPPGWTLLPLQRLDDGANGVAQTVQPTPTTTVASPAAPAVASAINSQIPTLPVPAQDQTSDNLPPANGASSPPVLQPTPTVPSVDHRAESPSQEWTDVAPRESFEGRPASSIPTTWGSNGESANSVSGQAETHPESTSNGKRRTASVEETPDEEV
jgi:E3 ubiquitin-protein ligase synoviolin